LGARESADEKARVENQLADLRVLVGGIGGRVFREVPENDVSAFKRKRVTLPDGTFGYRVVRPEWEGILTSLRRGEANALAVPDIDRATRDPRTLEDLIDVVAQYGVYVVSLSGEIDLSTDDGIDSARAQIGQRNRESRNTSRRVKNGKRSAAMAGRKPGGHRSFGWRKDGLHHHKREVAHILRELPRIERGVSCLTLAKEWGPKGIPTATGLKGAWRASTIYKMYTNPRMAGYRVHQGQIVYGEDGKPVKGEWEPILTEEQYAMVLAKWRPTERPASSRLGAHGTGYRTSRLLSPFLRCGKCNARLVGAFDVRRGKRREIYRCQAKGDGGCGGIVRDSATLDAYIRALVIADQKRVELRRLEQLPPWPRAKELADLQKRMADSTRRYEAGTYAAKHYWPSIERMEAQEAELERERRRYETRAEKRRLTVVNLEHEWDREDFTIEQKQAAIAKTLVAVIVKPAGIGRRFHPDQLVPIFQEGHETEPQAA
jgi:DNA invertase Pin-like site-specific DNA recombinase